MINITTQKVDTWKKRIQRANLKGSTYFTQEGNIVNVSASADHQVICKKVLGPQNRAHSLDSYISWGNVSATDLVELLYVIDK